MGMDKFVNAWVLAVGSSLDNLSIGIVYGTRAQHFTHAQNLSIAALNAFGTFLSMAAGDEIAKAEKTAAAATAAASTAHIIVWG